MARWPRLDIAGFHHIANRGVNRSNVFETTDDKDKFLEKVYFHYLTLVFCFVKYYIEIIFIR